jgi:hypothetical protein
MTYRATSLEYCYGFDSELLNLSILEKRNEILVGYGPMRPVIPVGKHRRSMQLCGIMSIKRGICYHQDGGSISRVNAVVTSRLECVVPNPRSYDKPCCSKCHALKVDEFIYMEKLSFHDIHNCT